MTFLRIFAMVFVVRMALEAIEELLGEPFTTLLFCGVLIFLCGHLLHQRWRERP